MYEWYKQVQIIIDEIDLCIKAHDDEALMLNIFPANWGIPNFIFQESLRKYPECNSGIICDSDDWLLR